jgi:two-component system, chemotaxis family, protein-glutamate methylesterase/glutaminase
MGETQQSKRAEPDDQAPGDSARGGVVVIGASAGGVEALRQLVSLLPADFPAAVLVVVHTPASGASALARILDRAGPLPAAQVQDDPALVPGRILVAPGDHHLVVFDHAVSLSRGPRENGHRPSIDVLFRTAASSLGPHVIAVVLSGSMDDGAAGAVAVKLRGGRVIVQSPDEALHTGMPLSTMSATEVDHVLRIEEMPAVLEKLAQESVPERAEAPALMRMEAAMADFDLDAITGEERPGRPSGWTCPDCHGSLFEIHEGGLVRFRCRVGHAWSAVSLVAQQGSELESALWVALRALEEKASLTLDLSRRAVERGHRLSGEQFERQSEGTRRAADQLRSLIESISVVDMVVEPTGAAGDEDLGA